MAHRQRPGRGPVVRQEVNSGVAELVRDPDRPRAWTLLLNGTPQSHVDLDDPEYLDFEYMRRLGHVVDLAAAPGRPLRVLHLGAGGLTLARYVAATRPGSRQLAADVDSALMEMIRHRLPYGSRGSLRVRIADARKTVEASRPSSFDLLVADVFAAGRMPAHLASVEFAAAAARALGEDGLFAANVADGKDLAYARAQAATARAVFPEVCLIADPGVLRGRRFGNLALLAGRRLPVEALTRRAAADPFPGRVVHGAGLKSFIGGAKPVTDAQARPSPLAPSGLFGGSAGGQGRVTGRHATSRDA
ncbi:MAG: spermidine synthase [Micromonosporaceae bacterium]